MAYPTALDSFTNPAAGNNLNSPSHSTQHINTNAAITAIETKVGITASTPDTGKYLKGTGAGTSEWSALVINRAFTWYLDGTSIDGVAGAIYIAPEDMTVTQVQTKLTSGTCTITLKNGSTTIDAENVTSSLATDTSITSAAITKGDLITLTLSSSSSPVGLIVCMECQQ